MLFTSLIPTRWRRNYDITDPNKPGFYNRHLTPYLQAVSAKACTHPVYTIAFVVVIGSGFYANLLDSGFFQPSGRAGDKVDFAALAAGRRHLHAGVETGWKWQTDENGGKRQGEELALVTLAFPDADGEKAVYGVPSAQEVQ